MSELNRWGLGIMLLLLVIGMGVATIEDVGGLYVFLVIGVAGFVLFVYEGDKGDG